MKSFVKPNFTNVHTYLSSIIKKSFHKQMNEKIGAPNKNVLLSVLIIVDLVIARCLLRVSGLFRLMDSGRSSIIAWFRNFDIYIGRWLISNCLLISINGNWWRNKLEVSHNINIIICRNCLLFLLLYLILKVKIKCSSCKKCNYYK